MGYNFYFGQDAQNVLEKFLAHPALKKLECTEDRPIVNAFSFTTRVQYYSDITVGVYLPKLKIKGSNPSWSLDSKACPLSTEAQYTKVIKKVEEIIKVLDNL